MADSNRLVEIISAMSNAFDDPSPDYSAAVDDIMATNPSQREVAEAKRLVSEHDEPLSGQLPSAMSTDQNGRQKILDVLNLVEDQLVVNDDR